MGAPAFLDPAALKAIRIEQANCLHALGWHQIRRQAGATLEEYLSSIPPVSWPPRHRRGRPRLFPVLVDNRMDRWRRMNRLGMGIGTLSFVDLALSPSVYWIWCHDGSINAGRSPEYCQWVLRAGEHGLTVDEGIAFHAQYPRAASKRFIDLPGSMSVSDARNVACMGPWTGYPAGHPRVWLHAVRKTDKHHKCGSATRFDAGLPLPRVA